jgi:hypothetical protein
VIVSRAPGFSLTNVCPFSVNGMKGLERGCGGLSLHDVHLHAACGIDWKQYQSPKVFVLGAGLICGIIEMRLRKRVWSVFAGPWILSSSKAIIGALSRVIFAVQDANLR